MPRGAFVYRALRPTPLLRHPLLVQETGLDLYVKHENHNPTSAFKVRGGLNLVGNLDADERRGVITASTGNHGQSIAMACQQERVPCTVVVPEGNNPDKNAAMRAYGATIVEVGRDFDEAREYVERVVRDRGLRYVHSANEPMLIAGVATYALELFEDLPQVDVILVPIGGGSGACGCSLVRTWTGSRARVIGVQASGADAFTRSWRTGERVIGEAAATFAEGIATRTHLRPDVRDPPRASRRRHDPRRRGTARRHPARAADDAQPGRGRRSGVAGGGDEAARSAGGEDRGLRDERGKYHERDVAS